MLQFKLAVLASLGITLASPAPAYLNSPGRAQKPLKSHDETFGALVQAWPGATSGADDQNEVMTALLARYAPVIKLSIEETYFPSSIEYMLPHFTSGETSDGKSTPVDESVLTPSSLDRLPRRGADLFLSVHENHNPQPFLDHAASYLFGPAGQDGGMEHGTDGRGKVREDIYGFWVDLGRGVVDLWYWTFYPYNFGKIAGPFGVIGNHVGDWERLRMRTINGSAVSVDYNAHSGGPHLSQTVRWKDVEKIDDRPVAYSAAGSHGLWATPGQHELAPLLDLIKLVDVTDDVGPIWDTKDTVVPFKYWSDPQSRFRPQHEGEERWLNFRGKFGNKGNDDCWWFKLVGVCQLVDAPPGPNRWFGVPPACSIATASSEISSYAFYLSHRTASWADNAGIKYVQLEQVCRRPKPKAADGKSGDYEDDDMKTWVTTGTSRYHGLQQHHIVTIQCAGVKAAVSSYRLSFCLEDGTCIFTTKTRDVCAYGEDKKGYVAAKAVKMDDPDEWWETPS